MQLLIHQHQHQHQHQQHKQLQRQQQQQQQQGQHQRHHQHHQQHIISATNDELYQLNRQIRSWNCGLDKGRVGNKDTR